MSTVEQGKIDFRSKPHRHSNFYFSEAIRSHKKNENQQFVVPWQMVKAKEREILEE